MLCAMSSKEPLFTNQALGLATQALFVSNPNPRVGCVLVSRSGEVIGTGSTQHAGGPHAEVMALRDASGKGFDTAGATAYVTLDPCSHHGRTGPCCDAIAQAGVAQAVASLAGTDADAWRARGFGILTVIGTVLDDNPRLDVREMPTPRQPHVVVVNSQLQLPTDANLLMKGRDCYVYTASDNETKKAALQACGATVIHLPNANGKVDLSAMLQDLGQRGINELHVEAGHKLNGSLVREGLVDELLLYLAPRLLGAGRGIADFGPLTALADGLALEFKSVETLGADLRVVARVQGRDSF